MPERMLNGTSPAWIAAFEAVFRRCNEANGEAECLLLESLSCLPTIALAEPALSRIGA